VVPLDRFRVLLLDMNSTFMFGEDRFGPGEDFGATYRALGGRALPPTAVDRVVRAAYAYLDARYADPACEDDFPSLAEALTAVAPDLPAAERALVGAVFAEHERGTVPPAYAAALETLAATHELRLLTNIWAPKATWVAELSRAGVLPLFRHAVFSSDTRSVKPSARLFRDAAAGVACAPAEVLVVGDSLRCDVLGAHRAGFAAAWVAPGTAGAPAGPPEAALARYRVPSLLALVSGPAAGAPAA